MKLAFLVAACVFLALLGIVAWCDGRDDDWWDKK